MVVIDTLKREQLSERAGLKRNKACTASVSNQVIALRKRLLHSLREILTLYNLLLFIIPP